MSRSHPLFIPPSSELVALCRSQIALLTKGLKADWSAVYLAEDPLAGEDAHFIPIAIYPQTDSAWEEEARSNVLPEVWHRVAAEAPLLLGSSECDSDGETNIALPQPLWQVSFYKGRHQTIFPLLDEDKVMGLLVTGRKKRQWNDRELSQIEEIAKTIVLACLMDGRQNWYQQQLSQQAQVRRLERDRIDSLLHQLRNPLTALRTFGKLLLKRILPEDRNRSVIQGILRESDRLQELLQEFETDIDVTDAVTLETNALLLPETTVAEDSPALLLGNSLDLGVTNLKDVIEPLLVSASAIAQEKKIDLAADIRNDIPAVRANARALREVLSNLIDNAIKYSPTGGTVRIAVGLARTEATGTWQGIAISDTGYGIPNQDRDRIFERHYRGVQAQGDIPGTGLGLAIVKELVKQMQGKIELISPNGLSRTPDFPGTTFIVWLTVAEE